MIFSTADELISTTDGGIPNEGNHKGVLMKNSLVIVLFVIVINAQASETDAVISCFNRIYGDGKSAALLCSNVKNKGDADAVVDCYNRLQGDKGAAARLCLNVKNKTETEAVFGCFNRIQGDSEAAALLCSNVKN